MAMDISGLNKAVLNTQKNLENAKKVNTENFNKISVDITDIDSEISKFNSYLQFESAEYPGCFCRIIDKEVEWVNPPMIIGVEYRTTERFNGKPVYINSYKIDNLPNAPGNIVAQTLNYSVQFLEVSGVINFSYLGYQSLPLIGNNSTLYSLTSGNWFENESYFGIHCLEETPGNNGEAIVFAKYIKN